MISRMVTWWSKTNDVDSLGVSYSCAAICHPRDAIYVLSKGDIQC
jgi:hypothetical protein